MGGIGKVERVGRRFHVVNSDRNGKRFLNWVDGERGVNANEESAIRRWNIEVDIEGRNDGKLQEARLPSEEKRNL